MGRKIIRVYLTPEQKRVLERICRGLGMDQSEVLRYAFLIYAHSISLVKDKVHGKF